MISYLSSTVIISLSCTISEILLVYFPKIKEVTRPEQIPYEGALSHVLVLINISLGIKSEVHSFTHSNDMMRPQNLKMVT